MSQDELNMNNEPLEMCTEGTGFQRDGYCRSINSDSGIHTVCAELTNEFLEFTNNQGNNLHSLSAGDKWCLCQDRWNDAYLNGAAPKVIERATNKTTRPEIQKNIRKANSSKKGNSKKVKKSRISSKKKTK